MYKQNVKELPEGILTGHSLEYDTVEADTDFLCWGTLSERPVKVKFRLAEEDFSSVKNRHTFRILMQSDILLSKWKSYEILDIE
jgi:hypothetical protein